MLILPRLASPWLRRPTVRSTGSTTTRPCPEGVERPPPPLASLLSAAVSSSANILRLAIVPRENAISSKGVFSLLAAISNDSLASAPRFSCFSTFLRGRLERLFSWRRRRRFVVSEQASHLSYQLITLYPLSPLRTPHLSDTCLGK